LKIALFMHQASDGGAQKVFLTLSRVFIEIGYDVDLVMVKGGGANFKFIDDRVNVIYLSGGRTLLSIPSYIHYLKDSSPDFVFSALAHNNIASILAKIFSRHKFKLLVTEHSLPSLSYRDASDISLKISYFLQKYLYRFSDGVIAVSQAVARDLSVFAKLSRKEIKVIGNPAYNYEVDVNRLKESEYLLPKEDYIVAVGRLHLVKRYDFLIREFKKVKSELPALKLLIVGAGEEKRQLEVLVKSLELNGSVVFTGFISNPLPIINAAKCFVMSSKYEGFGNVVVEALSCGVPVVSSKNGGVDDIIDEKCSSYVVEDIDFAPAIINAITEDRESYKTGRIKRAAFFEEKHIALIYARYAEGIVDE